MSSVRDRQRWLSHISSSYDRVEHDARMVHVDGLTTHRHAVGGFELSRDDHQTPNLCQKSGGCSELLQELASFFIRPGRGQRCGNTMRSSL